MSAGSLSYSNLSSSFALPDFGRCDVHAGAFVDADAYGDSYMTLGGAVDSDAGHTPLLEKDYCTNFTCCGHTLADLHELVGHFEEYHVVIGPNGGLGGYPNFPASLGMQMGLGPFSGTHMNTGMGAGTGTPYDTRTPPTDEFCSAVTPQSSSSNSAPSSAASSSSNSPVSPYLTPSPNPNRFPTLTSGFTPLETRECESAFTSVTIGTEGYDYSSDAAKDYLLVHGQSYHAQSRGQSFSNEQQVLSLNFDTLLHPSAYTISTPLSTTVPGSVVPEHTMYATSPPPSSTTTDSPRSPVSAKMVTAGTAASLASTQPIAPTPVYARHPSLSIITDLPSVSTTSSSQSGRTVDRSGSSKKRRPAFAKGLPRQREKTHKCPRPGCIKSYLNFNGLKYHLEKGTCDFGQN